MESYKEKTMKGEIRKKKSNQKIILDSINNN